MRKRQNGEPTALSMARIGEVWREQTIIGVGGKKGNGTQLFIVEDSQGRIKTKTYNKIKRDHSCADAGDDARLRPYEAFYNLLVRGAKKRKIECTLTYEDYFAWANSNAVCHYSGLPIPWVMYSTKGGGQAYFVDRKDNSKGYTLENCVPCLSEHNKAKGTMTEEAYLIKLNNK